MFAGVGGSFPYSPSGTVERMKTCSLHPSEELHALKRKNVYLFSAMHLPDFQVWARQCFPHVPHICWESGKLVAIFRKLSPLLSRWQGAAALTSERKVCHPVLLAALALCLWTHWVCLLLLERNPVRAHVVRSTF